MSGSFPESKLNRILVDFDEVVVAGTSFAKSRSTRLPQELEADVSIERPPHEMDMRIEGIGPGKGMQQLTHENGLAPRCRPWDYADFSCRLGSFTPLKWFARPAEVSPLQCARHGWRNHKRNGLICDCCLCEVDASGSLTLSAQDLHLLHGKLCPWKGNACPLSFLNFPILSKPELRGAVKKRLCSLLNDSNVIQHLPSASFPKPNAWTTEQLAIRASKLLGNTKATTDVKEGSLATAFTLALCGWCCDICSPSAAAKSNLHSDELVLRCNICNRRIGAWNFLPVDNELGGTKTLSSDADQQLKYALSGEQHPKIDKKPLAVMDPVREHHTYCPWGAVHPHITDCDVIYKSPPSSAVSFLTSPRAGWEWACSAVLDDYSDSKETKSLDFTEAACLKASHLIDSLVH